MTQNAVRSAERQLAWSRDYLRRARRRQAVLRGVLTIFAALALALFVYAMTSDGMPVLPTGLSVPGSGTGAPSSGASGAVSGSDAGPESGAPGAASDASSDAGGDADPAASSGATEDAGGAVEYVVTYDPRGGEMAGTVVRAAAGSFLTEPPVPVREGFTFAGWFADEARTVAWDFAKNPIMRDTTLYARWRQNAAQNEPLPQTGVYAGVPLWITVLLFSLFYSVQIGVLQHKRSDPTFSVREEA